MNYGLLSGCMWGLDTVILGLALSYSPFFGNGSGAVVGAGIHDMASALAVFIYLCLSFKAKNTFRCLKEKGARVVAFAALIGGPIGMLGYLMAIKNIGPGYTAIISSFFPAVGSFLAVVFLKEKMDKKQVLGLGVALVGVMLMGYMSSGTATSSNFKLGILGALLCVMGWGSEAVILTWGLKNTNIDNLSALQIRQATSALAYLAIIMLDPSSSHLLSEAMHSQSILIVVLAGVAGTFSYLFYYKALTIIGAARSMATNITYCVFAVIFSFILFGQAPSIVEVISCLLIMAGTLLCAAPKESV